MAKRNKVFWTIRNKLILAVVVGAVVAAAPVIAVQLQPHPADDEMLASFRKHRAKFERLREMILEDKALFRVTSQATLPENPRSLGLKRSRIAEYRKLMRQLRLEGGIDISNDRSTITFARSQRGFVVHGSQKGFVYTTQGVKTKLFDDLDQLSKSGVGVGRRPIEGNWYLAFDGY